MITIFHFSGDIHSLSTSTSTSTTNKTTDETINDSTAAAFMDQLEYISKGRSISSDGTNQPSSKRSRLASYHSSSNHNQQELHHRKLQLQQRAHHHQQQQETLLRKQEAAHAVVMAQHQQREQFIHSMRARQHQERQAALSTLAAANLVAFNRQQPATTQQLTRYTTTNGSCCWPAYGGQSVPSRSRHQLHQMSSFQQITPPGSVPFCWTPGPASGAQHPSACPSTCCQSLTSGFRSSGCTSLFQSGRQQQLSHTGGYGAHQEKAYGMDLVSRSKQAATMAAMACCYGSHHQHLVPAPIACAATPALTGGNPNTVAAAAAAAAMAGAPYCLGCVQGKCQVTWNKENAVNNGIMRSL